MNNSFTEQKIKDAARKVFQAKGYDAARTRDIAEEAGVNLALINYYYRSKESLFEEIMGDSILSFRNAIIGITNDSNTSVREKIETLTNNYFSIFMQEPDLPIFIFLETQKNSDFILQKLNPTNIIKNSFFDKQLKDLGKTSQDVDQIFINLMSLIVFPFIGNVIIKNVCKVDYDGYVALLNHRKKEIPNWIYAMFNL